MSNSRPGTVTKITIGDQEKELDKNGEIKEETFTLSTKKGQPLLSGIISKPISVEQTHQKHVFSGNVDAILASLRSGPGKK